MNFQSSSLFRILALSGLTAVVPLIANASPAPRNQLDTSESPAAAIERAVYKNVPEFYRDQSFNSQVNLIFGIEGSYPDNQLNHDGALLDVVYKDILKQQVTSGPILRTRDLPSPYNSSILESTSSYPNPGFQFLPLR